MATPISLRHLRCFVAVATTGSFTVAAGRLFTTQSSLTATIQQLETCVGLRLFDRTTRRVELTSEAIDFKAVAERIIRDFDTAIGDLQSVAASQRGLVRIGATPTVVRHVIAPMLRVFRARYPHIKLSVHDGDSSMVENAVLNGEIDFGISNRLNDFSDLSYAPILADPFGAVFPVDHELTARDGDIAWSDLDAFDYVGLTSDTGIGAQIEAVRASHLQAERGPYDSASNVTSLYALLNLGGKISVLPSLAAEDEALRGFQFRKLKEPQLNREICLITRSSRSASPNTQRMLEVLLSTIQKSGYLHAIALI